MTHDENAWQKELEERAAEAGRIFSDFVKTVATLRHPERGCPWDLEQDHKSLRRFMLEEAYEAAEAMLGTDEAHLLEELGDVLLIGRGIHRDHQVEDRRPCRVALTADADLVPRRQTLDV